MAISRFLFALFLLLGAWMPFSAQAQAQPTPRRTAAQIDEFHVSLRNRVAAGTELVFTIEGTPNAAAAVRIGGIERDVTLEEVRSGVYKGRYTITDRDHLSAKTALQATLQAQGRTAVHSMPLFTEAGRPAASVTALPSETRPLPPAPSARKPVLLIIDGFTGSPLGRAEPGTQLRYVLHGTPGAKATFRIEGVTAELPMREVQRGRYEGSYTIRRVDQVPAGAGVIASLESHGQIVRSRLNPASDTRRSAIDTMPPILRNLVPTEGETVTGSVVMISAAFDDGLGVGIDPRSVRIMIDGRDVTRNATITGSSFSFRADLQPGRHPVDVTVSDLAGHTARQAWSFNVAPPVASGALPLSIITPGNQAQLVNGNIEVRGRTTPDARIDVQGRANVAGQSQPVFEESLTSDASGSFIFNFRPSVAAPGTRYELLINASRNDVQSQAKLTLIQP